MIKTNLIKKLNTLIKQEQFNEVIQYLSIHQNIILSQLNKNCKIKIYINIFQTQKQVLIISCNQGNQRLFDFIISYIQYQIEQEVISKQDFYQYINFQDKFGYTALSYAVFQEEDYMVEKLLELKADYNLKSIQGETILHLASQGNCLKFLVINQNINPIIQKNTLLQKKIQFQRQGLNINAKTKNNSTLLHISCYKGNIDTVRYLLKSEIEINQRDIENHTPLHLAALSQSYRLIKLLLIKGADKNLINNQNKTPFQVAEALDKGNQSLLKLLKKQKFCLNFFYCKYNLKNQKDSINIFFYAFQLNCTFFDFFCCNLYSKYKFIYTIYYSLYYILYILYTFIIYKPRKTQVVFK
ncbi:hypothetical protein IMG5_016350 [Ichthyophthirius multifiliis]|uniref:Uncharacterized protein n=1 Tax=Ichthyophthirius multifiliis TaxID=5932 RepID=G0QKD1_ICHMU|nr:hypothetical protein IMG5_016350 [Ichthyophthirius multifiliis]EGR34319.1 hypothetical protein IMG5_016350 [Ichthyophthirius multifiliis]|eukprot:XP_004039623.1 hypothetical protein IMG5_016350 [Ichthyophthirius multifiliis]